MAALDTIIREYVASELVGPAGGSGREEDNANYISQLHDCLERRGVMSELQGFLRSKLVALLGEKWPHLTHPPPGDEVGSHVFLSLVTDFLRTHRLLFTLSVFMGESGLQEEDNQSGGGHFGKMSCSRAESLLESLGVGKDSSRSRAILARYGDETRNQSILECLLHQHHPGRGDGIDKLQADDYRNYNVTTPDPGGSGDKPDLSSRFKDKQIQAICNKSSKKNPAPGGVEERLRAITAGLERDKDAQIQLAINEFQSKEATKIRQELSQKLEFQLLSREKELLAQFRERSTHLRSSLEDEKAAWMEELRMKEEEKQLILQEVSRKQGHTPTPKSPKCHNCCLSEPPPPGPSDQLLQRVQREMENQSQEIKRLKDQLLTTPPHVPSPHPKPREDSQLLNFLSASKLRCEAIEEEARKLTNKLSEVKGRRSSAPSFPITTTARSPLNRRRQLLQGIARRTLHNPLLLPIPQIIRHTLPPHDFNRTRPLASPQQYKPKTPPTHRLNSFPLPTRSYTHPPETKIVAEKPSKNDGSPQKSEILSPPKFQGPPSSSSSSSPESIGSGGQLAKLKQREANLAAALTGGALSFEKVPSSPELEDDVPRSRKSGPHPNSSSPHSQRSNISSTTALATRRRLSFSQDNQSHVPQQDIGDLAEEPVKLHQQHKNQEEYEPHSEEADKSLSSFSLSGPKSTKENGGGGDGGDSDFWKL